MVAREVSYKNGTCVCNEILISLLTMGVGFNLSTFYVITILINPFKKTSSLNNHIWTFWSRHELILWLNWSPHELCFSLHFHITLRRLIKSLSYKTTRGLFLFLHQPSLNLCIRGNFCRILKRESDQEGLQLLHITIVVCVPRCATKKVHGG